MAQFVYNRLARHPGIWRVDGIGPIDERGRLGTRLTVCFSGLTDAGLDQPYLKGSLNSLTLELRIHPASLYHFTVGSLWREGKRIGGPEPINTSFEVDAGKFRLVALSESFKLNDQWVKTVIPIVGISSGKNRLSLYSTLYAIVPVLDNRGTKWLVVPTSELLRFYTGVSSRLLSGALQGRLDYFVNWDKSRIEGKRSILHVKQHLKRIEAVVLARATATSTAKNALLEPHKHLSSIQANNATLNENSKHALTIKARFPFNDTTQLYVTGRKMRLTNKGDDSLWAVFAMEILSCNHSLPEFIE